MLFAMNLSHLHELFPDSDFSFSMRMRRSDPINFFEATVENDDVLGERSKWLSLYPERFAELTPEGERLVEATWALAQQWEPARSRAPFDRSDNFERLIELGCRWEPDFLLLAPDVNGQFVLQAGCVCFPSSWAISEK